MNKIQTVEAFLLAGGTSRRMGCDKRLVRLAGQTLLERSFGILDSIFEKVTIVVGREEDKVFCGHHAIVDILKDKGPLSGIYSALLSSKKENIFITAVDMPFIDRAVIISMLENIKGNYNIIALSHKDRLHPVHAIYSKNILLKIKEMLQEDNLAVTSLLTKEKNIFIKKLPVDSDLLFNINTPEDLKKAEDINSRKTPGFYLFII